MPEEDKDKDCKIDLRVGHAKFSQLTREQAIEKAQGAFAFFGGDAQVFVLAFDRKFKISSKNDADEVIGAAWILLCNESALTFAPRPPTVLTEEERAEIVRLRETGMQIKDISRITGRGLSSVNLYLKEARDKKALPEKKEEEAPAPDAPALPEKKEKKSFWR